MRGLIIRGSLAAIATGLCLGTASLHAQQASQVKVTILVAETPVTGVPDKVEGAECFLPLNPLARRAPDGDRPDQKSKQTWPASTRGTRVH